MNTRSPSTLAALLAAGFLVACGGDDDDMETVDAALPDALSLDAAVRPSQLAYVANADSSDVTVIDTLASTTTTLDCSTLGATCSEARNPAVSPDGTLVAIPFRHSDNVILLDVDRGELVAEITDISFDEPYAAAFSKDGGQLWVVNKKGGDSSVGAVSIIDVASRTVTAVVDDAALVSPEGITLTADNAYVANRGAGDVVVLSIATHEVVTTVSVGGQPRFTTATADGAFVYASTDGSSVVKIATSDHSIAATVMVAGSSRNMAITPDGSTLYVGLLSGSIAAVDVESDTSTDIPVAGAVSLYGVAILHDGSLGLATDESNDMVYAFDPADGTVLPDTTFATGSTPRGIAAY